MGRSHRRFSHARGSKVKTSCDSNDTFFSDREMFARQILKRNVKVQDVDFQFLTNTCFIDEKWIFEVKALEARRWKDWRECFDFLVKADLPNAAHKVFIHSLVVYKVLYFQIMMEYIIAEALVSGESEYLEEKLSLLREADEQIENWDLQGLVYLDYFTAVTIIEKLKQNPSVWLPNASSYLFYFH